MFSLWFFFFFNLMLLCCSKEGTKVDGAWLWCWKPSHAGSPCLEGSSQLWDVPKPTVSGAQTSALSSASLVLKGQQKDLRRTGMATSAGAPCAGPVLWKRWQDLAHNFGSSCLALLLTLDQMWGWGLLWEPFLTWLFTWWALLGFVVWLFLQQHQVGDVFQGS